MSETLPSQQVPNARSLKGTHRTHGHPSHQVPLEGRERAPSELWTSLLWPRIFAPRLQGAGAGQSAHPRLPPTPVRWQGRVAGGGGGLELLPAEWSWGAGNSGSGVGAPVGCAVVIPAGADRCGSACEPRAEPRGAHLLLPRGAEVGRGREERAEPGDPLTVRTQGPAALFVRITFTSCRRTDHAPSARFCPCE